MAKKEVKLTVCKNNPNFFVNADFISSKLAYDLEKVKKYPGHQRYGLMKVEEDNFKEIAFINFADPHFFGDGFSEERCSLALNWIRDVANARVVFGGDVFDIASLSGKTNPHQSVLNNSSSIDLAMSNHYIGKIANKTICGVGGNHDAAYANRLRDTGISPLKYALEKFDIQYFEFNALIQIKVGEHYYNILVSHAGKGSNPLDGGSKLAIDFINKTGIRVDALFLGHNHLSAHGVFPYQYKHYNEKGKLEGIIDHQIQVFVDPSFQGENEHFLSKNIYRSNTNAMATILYEKENPYYVKGDKKNLPFILGIKRFPLLNEHSNDYTIPAKLYREKMFDRQNEIDMQIDNFLKNKKTKDKINDITKAINSLVKKGGKTNGR